MPDPNRACRVCGCTETAPCPGGCAWVAADLCSRCAVAPAGHPDPESVALIEVQIPVLALPAIHRGLRLALRSRDLDGIDRTWVEGFLTWLEASLLEGGILTEDEVEALRRRSAVEAPRIVLPGG